MSGTADAVARRIPAGGGRTGRGFPSHNVVPPARAEASSRAPSTAGQFPVPRISGLDTRPAARLPSEP